MSVIRVLTTKLVPTVTLGQGWTFERGTIRSFTSGEPQDRDDNTFGDVVYSVVHGSSTLTENVGCSSNLTVRGGKVLKIDAALAIAKKAHWRSQSLYVLLQATAQTGVREPAEDVVLLPAAERDLSAARLEIPASYAFLAAHGTHYVKTALKAMPVI